MRQSLKIALSLLVSLLIFSAFAVLSFTHLFDILETAFFQPRIVEEKTKQLTALAGRIERYHQDNIERFAPLLEKRFVSAAFLAQQSQEDIFDRTNTFGKLLEDYYYLQFVRFLGPEGKEIHYSTLESDLDELGATQKKYLDLDKADDSIAASNLITSSAEGVKLVFDELGQRFIYSFPVIDDNNVFRGSALFYFSKNDLLSTLLRSPATSVKTLWIINRDDPDVKGVLVDPPQTKDNSLYQLIIRDWDREISSSPIIMEKEDEKVRFQQISVGPGSFGYI